MGPDGVLGGGARDTHQDTFDPAEFDHALGLRLLLGRCLLGRRELVPVGEAILEGLLRKKSSGVR